LLAVPLLAPQGVRSPDNRGEEEPHRFVTGARAFQTRQARWGGRPVENTIGVQIWNDHVSQIALYQTEARQSGSRVLSGPGPDRAFVISRRR
jgi:hypothetical protein